MRKLVKFFGFSLALFLMSAATHAQPPADWTYCTGNCTGVSVGWTWCAPGTYCTVSCYGQPGWGYVSCTS